MRGSLKTLWGPSLKTWTMQRTQSMTKMHQTMKPKTWKPRKPKAKMSMTKAMIQQGMKMRTRKKHCQALKRTNPEVFSKMMKMIAENQRKKYARKARSLKVKEERRRRKEEKREGRE